ncbi:MAG TPA: ribonuclease HI family protein [Azospira sp.]|nr:ribonuclease HI family protein [Azospira sp.]
MTKQSFPERTPARWRAWFDGTAAPNPGRIGLGFVIERPDGIRSEHAIATGRHGCNNEAELQSLRALVEHARALGVRELQIFGDSKAAIDFVRGDDDTEVVRLKAQIDAIGQLLGAFDHVEIVWLPRHRNGDADRLARQALGLSVKNAEGAGPRRKKRWKK